MSTAYKSLKTISFEELFDGRLQKYGIQERQTVAATDVSRCLVGSDGLLWVYRNAGGEPCFVRYAGNVAESIRIAIAVEFDTEVVSENDYRYWGAESSEAYEEALNRFHNESTRADADSPADAIEDADQVAQEWASLAELPNVLVPEDHQQEAKALPATPPVIPSRAR